MELDTKEMIQVGHEGIKLVKNSKGYNWEIKTLNLDIDAVEKLNAKMLEKFGGGDE